MSSYDVPEPHSDPPDPPTYCNDPRCDECRLSIWECPGEGEG